ncbi:hypothetical protein SAMN05421504_10314 [Amycolatopsis xylanica]|uniref:Proline-rich protein n=1 Tax=Amycolatopsis xylanica TaxID=589385 RepID=A0A1H3CGX1_9PSEU|nr:hypothetical protein [Amycolatopsis xylanica]SDX52739.1 hypothetical protein SAMN05421504_10314 [Amycolatopsis xylanica]
MSTQNSTAVRVYLARVRTALADLPSAEVEEILEDVRPHLLEIEAELGQGARVEQMIERLGTPENYAAELRVAGDYPPAASTEAPKTVVIKEQAKRIMPRLALWGLIAASAGLGLVGITVANNLRAEALVSLVLILPVLGFGVWYLTTKGTAGIAELPEVRSLRASLKKQDPEGLPKVLNYFRNLSPAWWLVCAAALILFGLMLVRRGNDGIAALPLLVVAAVAIVWGGRKVTADKRWLWLTLPVSLFVVGGAFGFVGYVFDSVDHRYQSYNTYPASSRNSDGSDSLYYGNQSIENIYAFDAEGKPLNEIYLYDEDGRPITLSRQGCDKSANYPMKIGADNRFPRPKIEQGITDNNGNFNGYNGYKNACREVYGVPFSVAIPKAPATTSATPTPSPSPSSSAIPTPASPTPTK